MDLRGSYFLRRRHTFQNQDKRSPGRADIDRLIACVQNQYRFMKSFSRQHFPYSASPIHDWNP